MKDQGLNNFMVVEGFGDFTQGLESCDSVMSYFVIVRETALLLI